MNVGYCLREKLDYCLVKLEYHRVMHDYCLTPSRMTQFIISMISQNLKT